MNSITDYLINERFKNVLLICHTARSFDLVANVLTRKSQNVIRIYTKRIVLCPETFSRLYMTIPHDFTSCMGINFNICLEMVNMPPTALRDVSEIKDIVKAHNPDVVFGYYNI